MCIDKCQILVHLITQWALNDSWHPMWLVLINIIHVYVNKIPWTFKQYLKVRTKLERTGKKRFQFNFQQINSDKHICLKKYIFNCIQSLDHKVESPNMSLYF